MSLQLDLEQIVADWLQNEASASGSDRVLAAALGRVSTVRQERRQPAWLRMPMGPTLKIGMVAATAVVIAIASFGLLTRSRDIGPGLIVGSTPTPSSTPRTYPPAGEIPPGHRQSLTVVGVPLSFSVPSGGWWPGIQRKASDHSLYIAKDTAGGQRAEAVIFWTAWPGGVNTGPCHILLSQPIGSSAADLAEVVARAPGVDLVTGPSDVSLGGHEAKHLILTVREHLGCDPGYFFSWPDECEGTCWIGTQVGDRIEVWVVEVDGRRLVIEAETTRQGVYVLDRGGTRRFIEETTEYSDEELQRELQQIVESIRFES
jgi:hypothetical protein